jgi:hypothetical protein
MAASPAETATRRPRPAREPLRCSPRSPFFPQKLPGEASPGAASSRGAAGRGSAEAESTYSIRHLWEVRP